MNRNGVLAGRMPPGMIPYRAPYALAENHEPLHSYHGTASRNDRSRFRRAQTLHTRHCMSIEIWLKQTLDRMA